MPEVQKFSFIADDGKGTYERVRKGARAILFKDGKMLLGKEMIGGYCCIPGGGHEAGETLQETCVREVAEEMGILAEVGEELAEVVSYWKDVIFENHFFLCTYKGDTQMNQTAAEARMELQPIWVTEEEANAIFSDPSTNSKEPAWIGCYKRDRWVLENVVAKIEKHRKI